MYKQEVIISNNFFLIQIVIKQQSMDLSLAIYLKGLIEVLFVFIMSFDSPSKERYNN